MDYEVLFAGFEQKAESAVLRTSQQYQLYACLRSAILDGTIKEGTKLLSSRMLAEQLKIARNSVLYAYERLATEGFVIGGRQGTIVASIGLHSKADIKEDRATLAWRAEQLDPPIPGAENPLPFVPGIPAIHEFPLSQWRRCVERAWRETDTDQLGYMRASDNLRIRRTIAEYLSVSRGVRCEAEQVLVTDGTNGALELCARTLADPGETAWIEDPGYIGARSAFQAAGLRLEPVPVDGSGIAPAADLWLRTPPRLIYTTPSHQYPLGAVMSLERRLALLRNAKAQQSWIIEDDYDSEFRHHGSPIAALQGLTDDAPVIYLGTFSKVMFPALRLGFMVAPVAVARALRNSAHIMLLRGRLADQHALAHFIEMGYFTRHLHRMRKIYGKRREVFQAALERHAGDLVTVSGGTSGMHLSARLDSPVRDHVVSDIGHRHGLVLPPLSRFCFSEAAKEKYNGFVLGYGNVQAEHMDTLAQRFRLTIEEAMRSEDGRNRR